MRFLFLIGGVCLSGVDIGIEIVLEFDRYANFTDLADLQRFDARNFSFVNGLLAEEAETRALLHESMW